jgi:predicted RNase H-like HicB family nuclease
MKKLTVIAERTDTGYSAYVPDVPGIITTGDTYDEIKNNVREALELYWEGENESNLSDAVLMAKHHGFDIELQVDMQDLFDHFDGVLTKAGLAKITGLNQSLISQYASGLKNPSEKQAKKIEAALHNLADKLRAVRL